MSFIGDKWGGIWRQWDLRLESKRSQRHRNLDVCRCLWLAMKAKFETTSLSLSVSLWRRSNVWVFARTRDIKSTKNEWGQDLWTHELSCVVCWRAEQKEKKRIKNRHNTDKEVFTVKNQRRRRRRRRMVDILRFISHSDYISNFIIKSLMKLQTILTFIVLSQFAAVYSFFFSSRGVSNRAQQRGKFQIYSFSM